MRFPLAGWDSGRRDLYSNDWGRALGSELEKIVGLIQTATRDREPRVWVGVRPVPFGLGAEHGLRVGGLRAEPGSPQAVRSPQ